MRHNFGSRETLLSSIKITSAIPITIGKSFWHSPGWKEHSCRDTVSLSWVLDSSAIQRGGCGDLHLLFWSSSRGWNLRAWHDRQEKWQWRWGSRKTLLNIRQWFMIWVHRVDGLIIEGTTYVNVGGEKVINTHWRNAWRPAVEKYN